MNRFNQVRNDMFQRAGILPASDAGEHRNTRMFGMRNVWPITWRVPQMKTRTSAFTPVYTVGTQDSAHHYGSAFSPGNSFNHGKRKMLFILGTAASTRREYGACR
jgi:hypothetical protein